MAVASFHFCFIDPFFFWIKGFTRRLGKWTFKEKLYIMQLTEKVFAFWKPRSTRTLPLSSMIKNNLPWVSYFLKVCLRLLPAVFGWFPKKDPMSCLYQRHAMNRQKPLFHLFCLFQPEENANKTIFTKIKTKSINREVDWRMGQLTSPG